MKPQKNPPSRQALPRLALALILAVFAAPGARAVNAIINEPLWTSIVFGVVLLGLPIYYVAFRGRASEAAV